MRREVLREFVNQLVMELEDEIEGGKGDNLNPEDVDEKQLKLGIAVEREHTNDDNTAREIALDHLAEDPKYYTKLIQARIVDEPAALDLAKKYGITENQLNEVSIKHIAKGLLKLKALPIAGLVGAISSLNPEQLRNLQTIVSQIVQNI